MSDFVAHNIYSLDSCLSRVDEMLHRQPTAEYVTDRVNLDRVRSLLRMIYLRRRYVAWKEQQAQQKRAETMGSFLIMLT